jgi:hypothetical protein
VPSVEPPSATTTSQMPGADRRRSSWEPVFAASFRVVIPPRASSENEYRPSRAGESGYHCPIICPI